MSEPPVVRVVVLRTVDAGLALSVVDVGEPQRLDGARRGFEDVPLRSFGFAGRSCVNRLLEKRAVQRIGFVENSQRAETAVCNDAFDGKLASWNELLDHLEGQNAAAGIERMLDQIRQSPRPERPMVRPEELTRLRTPGPEPGTAFAEAFVYIGSRHEVDRRPLRTRWPVHPL